MNTIILGNSGSGKSTLAQSLSSESSVACLPLDDVAFVAGAERRPIADSVAAVADFIRAHKTWVIEGCYADIITPVLPQCERLVFLNPGTDTCIAHCHARPWEPDKFATSALQDEHLQALLDWVRLYDSRTDEYGLAAHRLLFDAHQGNKLELTDPAEYEAAVSGQSRVP